VPGDWGKPAARLGRPGLKAPGCCGKLVSAMPELLPGRAARHPTRAQRSSGMPLLKTLRKLENRIDRGRSRNRRNRFGRIQAGARESSRSGCQGYRSPSGVERGPDDSR